MLIKSEHLTFRTINQFNVFKKKRLNLLHGKDK